MQEWVNKRGMDWEDFKAKHHYMKTDLKDENMIWSRDGSVIPTVPQHLQIRTAGHVILYLGRNQKSPKLPVGLVFELS